MVQFIYNIHACNILCNALVQFNKHSKTLPSDLNPGTTYSVLYYIVIFSPAEKKNGQSFHFRLITS